MASRPTTARRLAVALARAAAENRCRDVNVLDLRKLSPVTEFFVLATGTSPRQMKSAAARVVEAGRDLGEKPFGVEGEETGWWGLVDYVNVVVHLFSAEARSYYEMELLWGDALRVDWAKGWVRNESS